MYIMLTMASEAYNLSPEAKKLMEKDPSLFTILQVGDSEKKEVQEKLTKFLEAEGSQVSPEVLLGEVKRLAYQAPPRR